MLTLCSGPLEEDSEISKAVSLFGEEDSRRTYDHKGNGGSSSVHSGLISSARLQAPCGWGGIRIQRSYYGVTGEREGVESERFILNPGLPLTGYAWQDAYGFSFFFF